MEIHRFTFQPPELIQNGETLAAIVSRRFVRVFAKDNPLPFDKEMLQQGVHILFLQDNVTQHMAVAVQPQNVLLCVRRLQKHGRSLHVIVNDGAAIISRPGKRTYKLVHEPGVVRNIGIARRTTQGLALEHYLYVSHFGE